MSKKEEIIQNRRQQQNKSAKLVPEIKSNQIDTNKFIENLKKIVKIKCKNTLM